MKAIFVIAAALGFSATASLAQEAGDCLPVEEAQKRLDAEGTMVAHRIAPAGNILFLVQRNDGTFKEMAAFPEGPITEFSIICHMRDFVGDPRLQGAAL